jgi:hypothetical protein
MRDEKGRFIKGNISLMKGKKMTAEHKKKIGEANKISQLGNKNSLGHKLSEKVKSIIKKDNEKNGQWKSDKASPCSKHAWLRRRFGNPRKCEHCGTTTAKRYEWSCKNHIYTRNRNDYQGLCQSCHKKFDIKHNNLIIFNRK